jgi:hypothetical protein
MKAPFNDPEFEIWGLNQLYLEIPRADRWFEIHPYEKLLPENNPDIDKRNPDHLAWLKQCPVPVYMMKHYEDIPNSIEYPIDVLKEEFRDYWTNSIAYMIALAIHEGFFEIHLYGCNMAQGGEYEKERPSVEYYCGVQDGIAHADKRFKKIYIPPESDLLKFSVRYGYEDLGPIKKKLAARLAELRQRYTQYEQAEEQNRYAKYQILGAINDCEYFQRVWS